MIRKLVLWLSILAIVTVPLPAWAGDEHGPEFHGRPEFHGQERVEHRDHRPSAGFYTPLYFYAPVCGWQPGYWAEQTYVDAYGNYSAALCVKLTETVSPPEINVEGEIGRGHGGRDQSARDGGGCAGRGSRANSSALRPRAPRSWLPCFHPR